MKARTVANKWSAALAKAVLLVAIYSGAQFLQAATPNERNSLLMDELTERVWQYELTLSPALRIQNGLPLVELPDITSAANEAQRANRAQFLAELLAISQQGLSAEQQLTHAILDWQLRIHIEEADYYWLDFVVTPYSSYDMNALHRAMEDYPLELETDQSNYLLLLGEYADRIQQFLDKTRGQAERGIRIPKAALSGVRQSLAGRRDQIVSIVERQVEMAGKTMPPQQWPDESRLILESRIIPAYQRLLNYLDEHYKQQAPDRVGLSQYPGGREYYRFLVRKFTTRDVSPQAVFDHGKSRLEEIEREQHDIRKALGFTGSAKQFEDTLRQNPAMRPASPAAIEARYKRFLARIEPLIPQFFNMQPQAPYGVRRADPATEAGLTFGYYQVPTPGNPKGEYRYNGSDLDSRSLVGAQSLIYHELIPGHHFHLALQQENTRLPPLRRDGYANVAFSEGWAEYAVSLAFEMGLFNDPLERYGALLMEAFLVNRLIVDPGMNYFGWSLEQAREFLQAHSFQSDVEINSETLRYSTDIPGQALAYKMGHRSIAEFRMEAQKSLGDNFDIRRFHDVVLGSGSMPMSVLQRRIEQYIERENTSLQKVQEE